MTKKATAVTTFRRPKGVPAGTVFYLDETREPKPWVAGLAEYEALEATTGKSFNDLGKIDDMRRLAYFSLVRDGHVDKDEEPYEIWAPKVLWLFDDEDEGSDAGEASPPTA